MLSWRKYPDFQNPRLYSVEQLQLVYKLPGTTPGMRVAITRELNARAGKTPLVSPQVKRQRAIQWAMLNANNTVGVLQREVFTLYQVHRYVSAAEQRKIDMHVGQVNNAITALKVAVANSKRLFPPKAKIKKEEKENA